MKNEMNISQQQISNRIFTIRGEQVMIDRDLAEMYQVETRVLNQAVNRNIERFPDTFRFQLTDAEVDLMVSQNVIPSKQHLGGHLPYAFTEQGVAMLSAVLRSEVAVRVSIQIMNAFVQMRKLIGQETIRQLRLSNIEDKLIEHDQKFNQIFTALEKNELPQKGIFYNGQVYDAHTFVSKIIKGAQTEIILIDNYIDETVLTLLSKRKENVKAYVYTKSISKTVKLDIQKHNKQYPPVEVIIFSESHDRFLLIDNKELYHIGASLKDLGKKWFAFSKMDSWAAEVINKIKTNIPSSFQS